MLVTFTNASASALFLSQLYVEIPAGGTVTTQRTVADLEGDQTLKEYVVAGIITLAFATETGDNAALGFDRVPVSYSNATRPAATTVPAFTPIWNTSSNALEWSDGIQWRTADGVIT